MHRTERTADTLKEEIAQIVSYELEDPRLTMVTVTDVRLSADKRAARVYVTIAGDEEEHKAALAALTRLLAAGVVKPDESVVLFNTGGALKYLDVLPETVSPA